MGRLIDADKLNEEFDDLITTFENTKNGKDYISKEELLECLKLLRGCVDEQPTVFDDTDAVIAYGTKCYKSGREDWIEKVVTELDNAETVKVFGSLNSGNRLIPVSDAIDIVRKGWY